MPLLSFFKKSTRKKGEPISDTVPEAPSELPDGSVAAASPSAKKPGILRKPRSYSNSEKRSDLPKLAFHCQLAHGSPTGIISGFNSIKDLYDKIAACFEIPASTILFCTLNTHKIDMEKLLGGQIVLEDLIFAHVKGQPKEIEILKTDPALGLTITDNGAGYAFIKRIKEGSTVDRMKNLIKIGDHIEKINGQSVVGSRHFEVAKLLKDIPVGTSFQIRLVEPNAFDFPLEPAKRNRSKAGNVQSGTKTLRFKRDGTTTIEEVDNVMVKAVDRINTMLETYMGISDSELARQIWDLAEDKNNPSAFATAIDESELGAFNFTDEFIFDLWASIGDIKARRVTERSEQSERL